MQANVSFGNRIIVTDDGKKYEKAGLAQSTGAVVVAGLTGDIAFSAVKSVGAIPFRSALKKHPQADVFNKGFEQAFINSGLKEKGVKIIDAVPENSQVIIDTFIEAMPKKLQKLIEKNKEQATETLKKKFVPIFTKGKNACFVFNKDSILINKEKFSIAGFHEMGHAMNKHMNTIGKLLQKTRIPFLALTVFAASTALFKRKKAEGEKPKNNFDKFTSFVKKHCAGLAFLGFIPMLAEEAMASINGIKLAKPVLDKSSLKALKLFNAKAYMSYIGLAAGAAVGTYVIAKVRDEMAHPKRIIE